MRISYDGTDFSGWQRQKSRASVQGTIEDALSKIFKREIVIMGASRTDAGVHALGQTVHFDSPMDPSRLNLRDALRSYTPPSIVVKEVWQAPPDFHAIGHAQKKTYKYLILNRREPSALRHRYTLWVRQPLDIDYLQEAAQFLVKKQDFKSFQSAGTDVRTTIREVMSVHWERQPDETLIFSITGDGFLKQMVRNAVGTLLQLHRDKAPPKRMAEILGELDRRKAGPTAAPQGLYLYRVFYPEALDNRCRKL